mgnify:CR=1 FL=1
MDITITKVKHGYTEYLTIYKGYLCRKLYDTNNKSRNKKDFLNYCKLYTNF